MVCMKKSVILLLIVLIGCATTTTKEGAQPADFRYGTEGLSMFFVPNLPPPRLFGGEPFNAMIQIENKGTTDLQPGSLFIYLSGFDPTIITGLYQTGQDLKEVLRGRGPYITKGDISAVNFNGRIAALPVDKYQPTIMATACYEYATTAGAQVCIDPNPYAPTSMQKVCTPGVVSLGSQGAPVAVTNVEVSPSPGVTRFKIDISNVGGSTVFKPGKLVECSPYGTGLTFNDVDFVQVLDVKVSGVPIKNKCRPLDNDFIRLTNGVASLFCELPKESMRGEAAYLTPLNIVLKYGYRQSISTSVEIRPSYAVT